MKLGRLITRRPKRATIRRGLISLVLGMMLTVVVAWWYAMYGGWVNRGIPRSESGILEKYRPETWPTFDSVWDRKEIGFTERIAVGIVYVGEDPLPREPDFYIDGLVQMTEQHSGFPWACMRSLQSDVMYQRKWASAFEKIDQDRPVFAFLDRGLAKPGWIDNGRTDRVLPLRPMWPGALYSVFFYSVLVFLMVCLVEYGWRNRHFRVDYRRKHGQCLKCKYPVGDFAVCPECGAAIKASGSRGSD